MATIRNTIALQDRMTPVLTAVISSLRSTQNALAGVDDVSSAAFNQMRADINIAHNALTSLEPLAHKSNQIFRVLLI